MSGMGDARCGCAGHGSMEAGGREGAVLGGTTRRVASTTGPNGGGPLRWVDKCG